MSTEVFRLSRRNIRVAVWPECNLNCIFCDSEQMEDFRSNSTKEGVITTTDYISMIATLVENGGFEGMTLTGGEPLLNKEWDKIVEGCSDVGMQRIGVTTNGVLLERYMEKNDSLPSGLKLLTVSLDTTDKQRFSEVTGGGKLELVLNGLTAVKEVNPNILVRANKVVMRSDLGALSKYLSDCEEIGVIDEINLLNLVLKRPMTDDRNFFQREFVSADEVIKALKEVIDFAPDDRYEFRGSAASGMQVILKDTNQTLRHKNCKSCGEYCQEGFYTTRIATDGTIMNCPGLKTKQPYIDGREALKQGKLSEQIKELVQVFDELTLSHTLIDFFC